MNNKILVRTITELSYAGEMIKDGKSDNLNGVLLKPSPISALMIWFPIDEIQCIITPDGRLIEEGELANFIK